MMSRFNGSECNSFEDTIRASKGRSLKTLGLTIASIEEQA
jgi:hypothetical protein